MERKTMFKMRIKIDVDRVLADNYYEFESYFKTLDDIMAYYHLVYESGDYATGKIFKGVSGGKDFSNTTLVYGQLKDEAWFMNYVLEWDDMTNRFFEDETHFESDSYLSLEGCKQWIAKRQK